MSLPATYAHAMPFGAELRTDGTTRFRLWAPGQTSVKLALEDRGELLAMHPQDGGWFELVTDRAAAGARYRFALDDGFRVPDPASRCQPADVHEPSMVVDPRSYAWQNTGWVGRPWEETVLYELHVGAFSPEGTFAGVAGRLDHLVELGLTAIELMPIAEFPGTRNWGYDGVLLFAPDAAYGTPDELKALIDAAHGRGLMVFLDVVYNHFGPDGNYLSLYAPGYFDEEKHTPWGAAVNFGERPVRDAVIHNALFWLEEYRFDGLRLDAVDRIIDESEPQILFEVAEAVRRTIDPRRHVHLVLENDRNDPRLLARDGVGKARFHDAQWCDDIHHVYHVLLTGDRGAYYEDFADHPTERLAKALSTGFVYQGEKSRFRGDTPRGMPSAHLPPTAFVAFIQNHDQIGNRAFGERMSVMASRRANLAMLSVLLLAPQVPLLFMGEEWGATQPFLFFTDFHDELADAVREGRRREFQGFPQFADPAMREKIPDPNAPATFAASRLDWSAKERPEHAEWLAHVRALLQLRRERIVPLLPRIHGHAGEAQTLAGRALRACWRLADGGQLVLLANLGDNATRISADIDGEPLHTFADGVLDEARAGKLPPWSIVWLLAT